MFCKGSRAPEQQKNSEEKNIQQKGIKQGINQGRKQGIKQGIKQGQKEGEIKLARKIAETIGIEETTKITGISKEEILNKKI